jgi:hypothetical protein
MHMLGYVHIKSISQLHLARGSNCVPACSSLDNLIKFSGPLNNHCL